MVEYIITGPPGTLLFLVLLVLVSSGFSFLKKFLWCLGLMQWLNISSLVPQALFSSWNFPIYCWRNLRRTSRLLFSHRSPPPCWGQSWIQPYALLQDAQQQWFVTCVCSDNLFTWELNNSPTFSLALLTRSSSNSSTSAASTLCHPHHLHGLLWTCTVLLWCCVISKKTAMMSNAEYLYLF